MDQDDGGRNEKWMDLESRIKKTWVERKGTAQGQPAPTVGNSDSSRLREGTEQTVSSVQDHRCERPVKDWVDKLGARVVTRVCNSKEKFQADDTNLNTPMALSILI